MDTESCVKCNVCCKELNLLEVHFSSETLLAFARRLLKDEVSLSPVASLEGYNMMLFQPQNHVSNFCLCGRCNDSLKNAYFFKETCISTDSILSDHLRTNCEKVDLKQLICTLVDVKDSADLSVCRLCRSFSNTSAVVPLDDIVKENSIMEVFQKHIPEVNLLATQDPNVCQVCQESLINFTNLLFLFRTGHGKILNHHGKWLEIKEEMTGFDDIQIDENRFQAHVNHIKEEPMDNTVERLKFTMEDDKDNYSDSINRKRMTEDDDDDGAEMNYNEMNSELDKKERAKMLARERMRRYRAKLKDRQLKGIDIREKELANSERNQRRKELSKKYSKRYRDKMRAKRFDRQDIFSNKSENESSQNSNNDVHNLQIAIENPDVQEEQISVSPTLETEITKSVGR